MKEEEEREPEVPEGAAVFPLIPAELGVDPLLLAVLHATVFLSGSEDEVVDPAAADEAIHYITTYVQRLNGPALLRVEEDLRCLVAFAREEKWPKQLERFVKSFLEVCGAGEQEEAEETEEETD
jgi:hypothetical protein